MLDLDHWCACIEALNQSFLSLNFQHVYREYNHIDDRLSKEPPNLDKGYLNFLEFMEGELIHDGSHQIFN